MNALARRPACPGCGLWFNAGRVCADCGVAETQTDLNAQQTIEHQPGAQRFDRPAVCTPSKRFRSDGNETAKH